jgi:hypothetical protein
MLRFHIILYTVAVSLILGSASAQTPVEPELHIAKFSSGDLTGWKDQVVYGTKNSSVYSFVKENGKSVLMGKSVDGASGLIRKIEIDPKKYPVITWSWKIDHTVKKGNERIKGGHDFAAKIYVIFPRGLFSSTRAIEYVWGNVMHKDEKLRSPYSNNMVMIAVDTGDELAGQWTFHKRNVAEDYRSAFGEEIPKIGAIAVMTDSDNTHESAVGYYGDITVMPASKEDEQKQREQKQKEQMPKELPSKEQPLKEQQKKEPKPKEQPQKEQPNGNNHHTPPPAAPLPASSR